MIKKLAADIVAKISAGEVVESPAAVVKELLENSVDAGATQIRIAYLHGGLTQMSVQDNGCGVASSELNLALEPHATSKVSELNDLYRINTLGFRGEALASIAAVSKLSITSRTEADDAGRKIRSEGGHIMVDIPTGSPVGTNIVVDRLFYNTPARLKFVGSNRSESTLINRVFEHYALCYPHIAFTLKSDHKVLYDLPITKTLLERVGELYGTAFSQSFLKVSGGNEDVRVSGVVSTPMMHRGNRSRVSFFVNGRYVRSQVLEQALFQAYRNKLPSRRFPIAIITINVAPDTLDVNIHPTKQEVKFAYGRKVASVLYHQVDAALNHRGDLGRSPGYLLKPDNKPPTADNRILRESADSYFLAQNSRSGAEILPPQAAPHSEACSLEDSGALGAQTTSGASAPVATLPLGAGKDHLADNWRVIGQLLKCFILIDSGASLVVIDQHAAAERIHYNRILTDISEQGLAVQLLLVPAQVTCLPEDAAVISEHLELFSRYGFGLEEFGRNIFLLREVPAVLGNKDCSELIFEILDKINSLGAKKVDGEDFFRHIAQVVACRAAIKAGDTMPQAAMEQLVLELRSAKCGEVCPHNRPVFVNLSHNWLEREFLRKK